MNELGWVAVGLIVGIPIGMVIGYAIACIVKPAASAPLTGTMFERDSTGRLVAILPAKV